MVRGVQLAAPAGWPAGAAAPRAAPPWHASRPHGLAQPLGAARPWRAALASMSSVDEDDAPPTRPERWRRRQLLEGAALAAVARPQSAFSAPTMIQIDALVWKANTDGPLRGSTCTAATARAAFGPRFINYLARFLLAYDVPSRRLWRERAAEIPVSWSRQQVIDARTTHLGEFAGAIESALCDFTPEGGTWSVPLTATEAVKVRQLLVLLRSRYGQRSDALRQLALLFSLLPPGVQPTSSIEQLAAEQEVSRYTITYQQHHHIHTSSDGGSSSSQQPPTHLHASGPRRRVGHRDRRRLVYPPRGRLGRWTPATRAAAARGAARSQGGEGRDR